MVGDTTKTMRVKSNARPARKVGKVEPLEPRPVKAASQVSMTHMALFQAAVIVLLVSTKMKTRKQAASNAGQVSSD